MGVSWLKTGAASADIAKRDEQAKQEQQEQKGLLWRFSLKDKEEARITFVDGDLSPEGFLLPPRFYEHGLWNEAARTMSFYVCPEKTMPEANHKCPLCAAGDRATLVAVFTVIDHREIKTKSGKIVKDQKKLFVAKPTSMEMLTKIAVKRGGLAGCTFDVSRMGDKSAAIGSMFDFVEKNKIEDLQQSFVEEVEENGVKKMVSLFLPADYTKEIVFRTPEEMLKLGIGAKGAGYSGMAMSPGGQAAKPTDYAKDL
jgi:hypothetical protein